MQAIKLLTVGDGASGKSSLLITYTTNSFPQEYVPTVFDNYAADVMHKGVPYTLGLWDTAGQEDYDRLRPLSYPQTDVVVVCFSIQSPASLDNVREKWVPELRHYLPNAPIVLVGCKSDLRSDPSRGNGPRLDLVTREQAEQVVTELKLHRYVETSALRMNAVGECFDVALEAAVDHSQHKKRVRKAGRTTKDGVRLPDEPTAPIMPEAGRAPWIYPDGATYSHDMKALLGIVVDTSISSVRGQSLQSWEHDVTLDMSHDSSTHVKAHRVVLASASPLMEQFFKHNEHMATHSQAAAAHSTTTVHGCGVDAHAHAAQSTHAANLPHKDAGCKNGTETPETPDPRPPPSFLCPIALEVMRNPVSTVDGHCYERECIVRWLQTNDTSPKTGLKLPSKCLTPAIALRNAVEEWYQMYGAGSPVAAASNALATTSDSTTAGQQATPPARAGGCVTFVQTVVDAIKPGEGMAKGRGAAAQPNGFVQASSQWHHTNQLTPRSLQNVVEWLYCGDCTCPGVRRVHGTGGNAPQAEQPFTGSTDQADWLDEITMAAAVFQCPELETFVENIRTGNQWLNPSFATYLSDQTGNRARDLFLGKTWMADVIIILDDGTQFPAHSAILAARCPYFKQQLGKCAPTLADTRTPTTAAPAPAALKSIRLPNVGMPICYALLEFIYRDHCTFDGTTTPTAASSAPTSTPTSASGVVDPIKLFPHAHALGLQRLVSLCELQITKTIDAAVSESIESCQINLVGLLTLCSKHGAGQLEQWLLHFISTNILPMKQRTEWRDLGKGHRAHVEKHQWPSPQYLAEAKQYRTRHAAWEQDVKKIRSARCARSNSKCSIM